MKIKRYEGFGSGAGWEERGGKLCRRFRFADFAEALAFINRVAAASEEMGHHPEMHWSYADIEIRLSTHDAGGAITQKDIDLSAAIDACE